MTEGANYEDHDFYCAECDLDWPCDEARLIAEVDRLHRQITQLADELDDTGGFNDVVSRSRRQCAARLRALLQAAPSPDNQEKQQ